MRDRPGRRRAAVARLRAIAAAVTAIALTATLGACAAAPRVDIDLPAQVDRALPDDIRQQLEDSVVSAMSALGAPGAIVGVWAPWSGSWVAGLGTTTVGGPAVSADMTFRVADVTRPMTCDVLWTLAGQGVVDVDDPVSDWVSGVPDLGEISLRELCDGTSGIGSYEPILTSMWLSNPERRWNPRELAAYGLGQERTASGQSYRDSDAAFLLLGLALERATNRSAASYLETYVFDPLALENTLLPNASTPPTLTGNLTQRDAAGVMNCAAPLDITNLSSSTGFTDSGVVSDITDLGRYVQALAASTRDAEERFAEPLPADPGAPTWLTTRGGVFQAGSLVGQYGAVPGYMAAAFADPETGMAVAVVLNNSAAGGGWAANLAWELAAIVSKAPAAPGETAPAAGLPWTAQQYRDAITAAAICPPPAQ